MQDVEHPTSVTDFAVQTEVFSGPLELLIELIEKRKLLVNDISLATVTDDYIAHVAEMERNPLKETTRFVALASTLLLIKSKSLLPVLSLTSEEEESIEDLQDRLKQYQIFRDAGNIVADRFGKQIAYKKTYAPYSEPLFVTDKFTETDMLATAIQEVIAKLPKKEVRQKVRVRPVVSLEEMIDRLKQRVERQLRFGFKEFTGHSQEPTTVIVGFLAVLEMVKQGNVLVKQHARFSDIQIERESNQVPRYI
ncbi:MAG: segregation/condensation protein A [Candidatus Pacebacteria bacterium]|nr:segregation/condensation protein A [Candidatus Paceibacterota bacterium]